MPADGNGEGVGLKEELRGPSWHFYTVHRSGLVILGRSIGGT